MADRIQEITKWLGRFERSGLAPRAFFAKYRVPFSRAQLYRYQRAYQQDGPQGLGDGRSGGNNRRIHAEAEGFLVGMSTAHPEVTQADLRQELLRRFSIDISQPGLSLCLQRLGIRRDRVPPCERTVSRAAPHAGFELVAAMACHFGWPQWTADVIGKGIARGCRGKRFASEPAPTHGSRTRRGRFTARYNRRRDVRAARFASVDTKRAGKAVQTMDLAKVEADTMARKCLAVLALPFVTYNGDVRTVDTPAGKALRDLCGFRYRQATLTKFLAELKYLGVSGDLLRQQVAFWQGIWRVDPTPTEHLPLLCYYVDGNTKALWSMKRVKKHKVTMLGRVMGCLEQVFIHDGQGRPIYFETFSGQAPLGEYVLGLFDKIEKSLEGPGPSLPVHRAIVMDGAHNSVRTLRAFAAQDKYHYITSLDDNQWDFRRVRKQGSPKRYQHGDATLWDCEIEMEDSRDNGYLFVTRAIKIEWDRGKETYLITSLPPDVVDSSQVVKAYFDRWPDEELSFKVMKAVACLHRVAGYGKKKLPDLRVRRQQEELARKLKDLRHDLRHAILAIADEEWPIARLIPRERRLRARSEIIAGERILPEGEARDLRAITRAIQRHQGRVRVIRKTDSRFKQLRRAEREWFRLQGKDTVYKVDVELDQILTFFRVSLVNIYTHLARLMGYSHLSLVKLLYTVLRLSGRIVESQDARHVILDGDENDPAVLEAVGGAISKINALGIRNLAGQKLSFAIAVDPLK